jgi:hypothetical protein
MLLIILSDSGKHTFTKTDNATYIAGVTCVFGKENFWWIASIGPEMSEEKRQELRVHFTSLGFTAPVAIPGVTTLVMKKITMLQCNEDQEI